MFSSDARDHDLSLCCSDGLEGSPAFVVTSGVFASLCPLRSRSARSSSTDQVGSGFSFIGSSSLLDAYGAAAMPMRCWRTDGARREGYVRVAAAGRSREVPPSERWRDEHAVHVRRAGTRERGRPVARPLHRVAGHLGLLPVPEAG